MLYVYRFEIFHLHMRPVDVRRIGELRLLADNLGKYDVLLEEEHLQLARFDDNIGVSVGTGRTLGTQ